MSAPKGGTKSKKPTAQPPRTLTAEQIRSGASGFNRVGGGQSETYYRHDLSHTHTSGKGVVARSDEGAIQRPPRSFEGDRSAQMKRHLATTTDTFLRTKPHLRGAHQEVQVAHDKDDPDALVLSTNTHAGNKRLREGLSKLKTYIQGEPESGSSDRQERHHNKLHQRMKPSMIKKMSVISEDDEGATEGLHAERRLVASGHLEPHGTMRPCATCFGNLDDTMTDDLTKTGPGKWWSSTSSNADDGGDHVSNFRTRVTLGLDKTFHHDYGSDSDSDVEEIKKPSRKKGKFS